jgi:hypothetical protein
MMYESYLTVETSSKSKILKKDVMFCSEEIFFIVYASIMGYGDGIRTMLSKVRFLFPRLALKPFGIISTGVMERPRSPDLLLVKRVKDRAGISYYARGLKTVLRVNRGWIASQGFGGGVINL